MPKHCAIHPTVELRKEPVKLRGRLRLIEVCPQCDELVEQLKTLKAPKERHLK